MTHEELKDWLTIHYGSYRKPALQRAALELGTTVIALKGVISNKRNVPAHTAHKIKLLNSGKLIFIYKTE